MTFDRNPDLRCAKSGLVIRKTGLCANPAWLSGTLTQQSVVYPRMPKKKSDNFRTEIYFVRGKMKKRRIPLIDGLEVEEFIRRNADDAFLVQEGHFDILHERELARAKG